MVIAQGLTAGEEVVTDGQLRLTPGRARRRPARRRAGRRRAGGAGGEGSGERGDGSGRGRRGSGRKSVMNIAEPFIRRPVATTLLVTTHPDLRRSWATGCCRSATCRRSTTRRSRSTPTCRAPAPTRWRRRWRRRSRSSSRRSPASPRSARRNSQGSTNITLQFDLSRDIDAAAQDVQSMIARARALAAARHAVAAVVPEGQPGRPAGPVPDAQLDDAAAVAGRRVRRDRARAAALDGQRRRRVNVFGAQKFAVRIDVDPTQLASRQIGIDQVAQAIADANVNRPTGTLYGPQRNFVVQTSGQLMDAEGYRPDRRRLPQRQPGPAQRGRATSTTASRTDEDGELVQRHAGHLSRDRSASRAPTPSRSSTRSRRCCRSSRRSCRRRSSSAIRSDRSVSIRESVDDVKFTLVLTVVLVVLVIFLFLRNLSATIIPSLALPFSIVGTFAVMWVLGYSLDNLSLMALTLSVGFVVDDAIVMLENIVRHMEMGKPRHAGGARRVEGDRLHDRVDDAVAGRGLHPDPVHGRHRRPADARVRGDDRRGDPGLRPRVADADADAVQPLPQAAARR